MNNINININQDFQAIEKIKKNSFLNPVYINHYYCLDEILNFEWKMMIEGFLKNSLDRTPVERFRLLRGRFY